MPEVTKRACGSCTACCKSLEVTELNKPAGKWCAHCKIGNGCNIYFARPDSCIEFRCQWLNGLGDKKDRPDRAKLILDHVDSELLGEMLQIWEVSEGALGNRSIKENTARVLGSGVWVAHIPLRGQRRLLVPKGKTVTEEILDSIREEGIKLAELEP